jgi:RNA polymerase sigma factor (sigma-70 family)
MDIKQNGINSNDSLVEENLIYAKKLAKRFYGKRAHSQAELDDVISSAYLGLCEAASRYDVTKKGKFQTYSYLRIVGSMYDYLTVNGGFSRANYKRFGSDNSDPAQKIRVAKDIKELKSYQSVIDDWGIKLEINANKGMVDLSYLNQKTTDQVISEFEENERLRQAIDKLSPDLQKIIKAKFFEGKTLDQIAENFPDYSRSHVSRLVAKGLSDLRKKLKISLQ